MEDLADALYRSKSSLTTVLEEAERLAENYDCRLRKRSNYGLSLEGHEEDIRKSFYRFVDTLPMQDISIMIWMSVCRMHYMKK